MYPRPSLFRFLAKVIASLVSPHIYRQGNFIVVNAKDPHLILHTKVLDILREALDIFNGELISQRLSIK